MEFGDKIFFAIIYSILAIIFFAFIFICIRKRKTLGAIDYFNLYYLLVYFIVPIFFFFNTFISFGNKYAPFLEYDLKYHYIVLVWAVLFIVLVNVFYFRFNIGRNASKTVNIETRKFLFLNIFFSILGIFSYYMWTKVYGFPFGILKYADALRDNIVVTDNPYTFFQPFSNFTIFAAYNWLVLFKSYSKLSNKLLAFLSFVVVFFFALLSALATDSRFLIIILFLVPIIFLISKNKKSFRTIIILGFIAILALGRMDNLTANFRDNSYTRAEASNVFELISYEFGFTYANRINLAYNLDHEDIEVTEWDDIKSLLFSWIPKRLKPTTLQQLDDYNTSLYTKSSGTIPTDIVTAAVYKGRFFGIVLLALFIAFVLKIFDNKFLISKDNFSRMFYIYFCVVITLRLVAYYELSRLLLGGFSYIVYYVTIYLLCGKKVGVGLVIKKRNKEVQIEQIAESDS